MAVAVTLDKALDKAYGNEILDAPVAALAEHLQYRRMHDSSLPDRIGGPRSGSHVGGGHSGRGSQRKRRMATIAPAAPQAASTPRLFQCPQRANFDHAASPALVERRRLQAIQQGERLTGPSLSQQQLTQH